MIDSSGQEHTFEETHRTIIALAKKLEASLPNLRERQPIGVAYPDKRWHFLLTLAAEALGVTTLPFVQPMDPNWTSGLSYCGMLLGAETPENPTTIPFFRLEKGWLETVSAEVTESPFTPHRFLPGDVVSIVVTSGSGGVAKCIPLHRQARDLREYNRICRFGIGPATRYLAALPITVATVDSLARATLRCGGAVKFWCDQDPASSLLGVTHATFLPTHLAQLMTVIAPRKMEGRERFKLFSIGAPLSRTLRERASVHLHAEIFNMYGCNEVSGCASIDESGVAHVLPGVELEVVDARNHVVEFGETGLIRIRSEEMAVGYLDAQTTREKFVDGWFMTGDIGAMVAPRRFQLTGRTDFMINIGGLKISPDEIEDILLRSGLARDVAVCSLPNIDGVHELHVAAAGLMQDHAGLARTLTEKIGPDLWPLHLLVMQRIPRSSEGKIQRAVLADEVRQARDSAKSSQDAGINDRP